MKACRYLIKNYCHVKKFYPFPYAESCFRGFYLVCEV